MDNDHHGLLGQLFRLGGLLRHFHMQNHRDHGPMGSPHQGQGRILALLRLKPEISQKELSTILDIRSQSLGELLAKLERQGYITRTPSTEDRRGLDVHLTESGRTASEQPAEADSDGSLFECLNQDEQVAFGNYVERLIKALEDRFAADGTEHDLFSGPRGRGFGHRFHGGREGFARDFGRFERLHRGCDPQEPVGTMGFGRGHFF